MVKWLVFLAACHGHNPAFCPQGTADDGACTDAGANCFGEDPFVVCLASPPTAPLMMMPNLDTTNGCDEVLPIGCVVEATDVTINNHVTVHGSRPLIIFASGTITITPMGILDVTGSMSAGVGANLTCATDATAAISKGGNGGGGGGGSFATRGGDGGAGGGGATGGLASSTVVPATLEGGCDGSAGANGGPGTAGMRGFAGGGVYLIAEQQMSILGAIDASGGGGDGGNSPKGGAGGGGSGGMIVLRAPMFAVGMATEIIADGGGGGGGGGNGGGQNGSNGGISLGSFGPPNGGKGGNNNGAGGDGANATNAAQAGATSSDGGGAGGGGAGVIHVFGGSLGGGYVSPAPS